MCLLAALSGCGDTTTVPQVPALHSVLEGVAGGQVLWQTDQPSLGAVRYGFASGHYDRLAYPAAADDADKQFLLNHAVPLLEVAAGVPVYIQRTDRTEAGHLYVAAEETVTFSAPAVAGPLLRMTSLDVQFGDAHCLELPSEGRFVLIDAGDPYERRNGETAPAHVRQWLVDRGITRLDVVMATHMHVDHYGGLLWGADPQGQGILDLYPVGSFLDVPEVSGNQEAHQQLLARVAARGVPRFVLECGMTSGSNPEALAWDPLVAVSVLNAGSQPEWAQVDYEGTRLNDDSILLKLSYGDVDIITGGDCEVEAEARILAHYAGALTHIEYYKAQHHGRYDANSQVYVQAIAPRVALIPVAFAAYSEGPDQGYQDTERTLTKLELVHADVFRFDSAEPIGFPSDNQTFWHTTFMTDGVSFAIRIEPSVWGL
jgi:beta-lactamase superfamily II metal-dependent hydrolase